MQRGVPQDVVRSGRYREVTLEDTFRFECKRCGRCCFRSEIIVTPCDLLGLCEYLGLSTFDFVEQYAFVSVGPESGLPILALDFEGVQKRRGGRAEMAPCPFLAFDGVEFACGVYPARPGCCRSYPLFRVIKDGEPHFGVQEVTCPAGRTDREYTVAAWIEREGLEEYHAGNRLFVSQMLRLTEMSQGRQWPTWFVEGLAWLWYGFSAIKEGRNLREKYALSMQLAEKVVDHAIKELPHLIGRGQCE